MFTIRPALPADEPFLWAMLYEAIYVPEGRPTPDRAIVQEPSLAHYVAGWGQQPGDAGLLAIDPQSGQPVGAAWLRFFTEQDPGWGFVDADTPEVSMALLPVYRGQESVSEIGRGSLTASWRSFFCVVGAKVGGWKQKMGPKASQRRKK